VARGKGSVYLNALNDLVGLLHNAVDLAPTPLPFFIVESRRLRFAVSISQGVTSNDTGGARNGPSSASTAARMSASIRVSSRSPYSVLSVSQRVLNSSFRRAWYTQYVPPRSSFKQVRQQGACPSTRLW